MSASSLLNKKNIFIGVIAIILFAALYSYSFSKTHWYDGVDSNGSLTTKQLDSSGNSATATSAVGTSVLSSIGSNDLSGNTLRPIGNPAELLPRDQNSQWSTLNPNTNSNNVMIPDLLDAGYHIGLDTIGQTLKNPSYDIRSSPQIPKASVSPWNNSTFEPDIARVPLEIGQGLQ